MRFSLPTLALASLAAAADSGWTGTIKTMDGGLGGTVMVVNDTTLMISGYTLKDASAPALHWWGSTTSDLPKGFRINNERVSQAATSDSLTIPLDAGHKASDFDYVGLWCESLNKNFGQAQLSKAAATSSGSAASASPSASKTGAAAGLSAVPGAVAALVVAAVAFMA